MVHLDRRAKERGMHSTGSDFVKVLVRARLSTHSTSVTSSDSSLNCDAAGQMCELDLVTTLMSEGCEQEEGPVEPFETQRQGQTSPLHRMNAASPSTLDLHLFFILLWLCLHTIPIYFEPVLRHKLPSCLLTHNNQKQKMIMNKEYDAKASHQADARLAPI